MCILTTYEWHCGLGYTAAGQAATGVHHTATNLERCEHGTCAEPEPAFKKNPFCCSLQCCKAHLDRLHNDLRKYESEYGIPVYGSAVLGDARLFRGLSVQQIDEGLLKERNRFKDGVIRHMQDCFPQFAVGNGYTNSLRLENGEEPQPFLYITLPYVRTSGMEVDFNFPNELVALKFTPGMRKDREIYEQHVASLQPPATTVTQALPSDGTPRSGFYGPGGIRLD